jgi:hypothetical protein
VLRLSLQDGTIKDDLDSTLHKRLNAGLSTFSIAQLSLLVSAAAPQSSAAGCAANTNII